MSESGPPKRASLMHWLDAIKLRPGMYLGTGPPNYGAMLDRLDTWIVGYSEAVRAHQAQDAGIELYSSFWQFLERRFDRPMEQGTIPTLRLLCMTDAEAWETYWRLLAEFRDDDG